MPIEQIVREPELHRTKLNIKFLTKQANGLPHLIVILILAMLAIAGLACGGDDSHNPLLPVGPATVQPAANTPAEIAPTATPNTIPTIAPTATSVPSATPAPSPTPTPAPTRAPAPTTTPEIEDVAKEDTDNTEVTSGSKLPDECLTNGSLTDTKLIATCSFAAMSLLRSVRAEVDFDLGALLLGGPPPGSEVPSIKMQVERVLPDDFRVTMTGPEGEAFEFVFVDGESYINDGASGEWFKLTRDPDETAAMLMSLNMVEQQLSELDNQDILWGETEISEDGSHYVVSYRPPTEQAGLGAPPMELQMSIDAQTFLQNSVSLQLVDEAGLGLRIAEFKYSDHNSPFTIEAPESFFEPDPSLMQPGSEGFGLSEGPSVTSLSKNDDGNVEVTFSEPVNLVGEVGLYVLEPSIGGYSLPYIGGSGTDTLTFSADVPDHPLLIPGESIILGFTFDSPESDLVGENGRRADSTFDEWVYPESP